MPLQYVMDMHCYQSISLVQDMVIVDVMKPHNNYIMHLTDIIITIIIVNLCISNIGYEPADFTVHPPPTQNCRGWVNFFGIGVECSQKSVLRGKPEYFGGI